MILNRQIQQHKQVRGGLVFRALPFGDIEIAPLPDIAHIPIDKDLSLIHISEPTRPY